MKVFVYDVDYPSQKGVAVSDTHPNKFGNEHYRKCCKNVRTATLACRPGNGWSLYHMVPPTCLLLQRRYLIA